MSLIDQIKNSELSLNGYMIRLAALSSNPTTFVQALQEVRKNSEISIAAYHARTRLQVDNFLRDCCGPTGGNGSNLGLHVHL